MKLSQYGLIRGELNMNILVCDDDFSIANSIAKYIKNKFKHEVFVSINREEALNIIHSGNIDLSCGRYSKKSI